MKTTINHNRANKMATAFCAAFVFTTGIWAQSNVTPEELGNCVRRLELMAAKTEKALKYEAPSVAADEINSAFERLELWANNTENTIRYRVPVEEQANTPEYAANDNSMNTDNNSNSNDDEFLTYNSTSAENK